MKRETFSRNLIKQARRLATLNVRGRPDESNLRRSVSAAYYSLFHFLIDQATRQWVGTAPSDRPLCNVLGRGYMHGEMKDACRQFASGLLQPHLIQRLPVTRTIPAELKILATLFIDLQEARHAADYDLSDVATPKRSDVLQQLDDLEQTIADWKPIAKRETSRFFLASLVTWSEIKRR